MGLGVDVSSFDGCLGKEVEEGMPDMLSDTGFQRVSAKDAKKDKHEQTTHNQYVTHLVFCWTASASASLGADVTIANFEGGHDGGGAGWLRRWKLTDNVDCLPPSQVQTKVSVAVKGRLKGTSHLVIFWS